MVATAPHSQIEAGSADETTDVPQRQDAPRRPFGLGFQVLGTLRDRATTLALPLVALLAEAGWRSRLVCW